MHPWILRLAVATGLAQNLRHDEYVRIGICVADQRAVRRQLVAQDEAKRTDTHGITAAESFPGRRRRR